VLYIVHFTAFCLGGPFFSGHGVQTNITQKNVNHARKLLTCVQNKTNETEAWFRSLLCHPARKYIAPRACTRCSTGHSWV